MPRRIEIELTSQTEEGPWTWRAAGAKQPRGSVDAALVPGGATVGTVLRAEVESGIDGIEVIQLLPAKALHSTVRPEGRIEVIGTPQKGPDVSVVLAKGRPRERGERDRDGGRDRPRDRRPRDRDGGDRSDRPSRPGRAAGPARPSDGQRPERGDQRDRPDRGDRRGLVTREPRRPTVPTVNRNELLAGLRPEQLPVAEQLLRGGIPAVRQAIAEQDATAKAAGRPAAPSEAILSMAEELLPAVRLAEWKDRALSAQSAGKDFRLRELRAVVAASRTVTLDERGRELAKVLRDTLTARSDALKDEWIARITNALESGRVLDALRATARAPEPGTRCPAELAVRLAEQSGAAMTADTDPPEWIELLSAVLESPVRRTVRPAGIPADEAAQSAARRALGSVPELARLLGLKIPPPPPRRAPSGRPMTRAGGGGSAPAP
jgi:hypothetical protein